MTITIHTEEQEYCLLFEVIGRLDASNFMVLKKAIDQVIYDSDKHILLDFSRLKSLNSDGLHLLYNSRKKLPSIRSLVVCQPNSDTHALMELSGLPLLIPIADNTTEGEMLLYELELSQRDPEPYFTSRN